jgi:hypothetical protein
MGSDNNHLTIQPGAHNSVDVKNVRYGGKILLSMDDPADRVLFNPQIGRFGASAAFARHPLVCVSWYGAVMLCNWLTEMTDGAGQIVYGGITPAWNQAATAVIAGRRGFRLPTNAEWDCAARYIGRGAPTSGGLSVQYLAPGKKRR